MVGIGRLKKTQKQHLNPTTASVDGIFRESGLTALFMGNFLFNYIFPVMESGFLQLSL